MADDVIPACREWLGLEPADLAFPHRVVGVTEGERDPLAIVRAADRRFKQLRTVPHDHTAERDALVARVETARDALLAAAARAAPLVPPPAGATHLPSPATPSPPPVPPRPVPPPVPPAITEDAAESLPTDSVRFTPRRGVRPRKADGAGTAVGVAALALAAAALAIYVAWPHLERGRLVARGQSRHAQTAAATDRAEGRQSEEKNRQQTGRGEDGKDARAEPPPVQPAEKKPEQGPDRRTEPPRDENRSQAAPPMITTTTTAALPTVPADTPKPAAVDVEAVRARVGDAVAKVYAATRSLDWAAAGRELETVADVALDDQQATDRVQRWRALLLYAERYPAMFAEAIDNAKQGREYPIDGRVVSVYPGEKAGSFTIKDRGAPRRGISPDAFPPELKLAILTHWCSAVSKPANHLYLGVGALLLPKPDFARSRREWETAAAGGEEHGRLLLQLLDDPVVRGP